jgi:tetratricopeptide (TPR) repeat protein
MFKYCRPLLLLFTILLSTSTALRAQEQEEPKYPGRGVRVIEVEPNGQAQKAGLQVMDLLTKYGKFTVIDHSSYYKAREFYLKNPDQKVKLELWRGRERLMPSVFPGTIGMDTNECCAVPYQWDSILQSINAWIHVPPYQLNVEFKEEHENRGLDKDLVKGRELIDGAEAEGTLTPTQILVARINMILDNAPEQELKKLDELLDQFIRSQPAEYIGYLGQHLIDKSHHRPARTLLKQYLLTDPDNRWVRMEVGYASFQLCDWNDAEAAADIVLANPGDLEEVDLWGAYEQKAAGAINRGDYDTGVTFAEKAFEISHHQFALLMVEFAYALSGNVEKFHDLSRRHKQAFPEEFETFKFQTDAAEALALSLSGQDALAREIVARWTQKDRAEARLKYFWKDFPHGAKVAENWSRLAAMKDQ